jgi:hypothetical protein
MISQVTSGPPLGAHPGSISVELFGFNVSENSIPIDIKKHHLVDNEVISVIVCGLLKKQPKQ